MNLFLEAFLVGIVVLVCGVIIEKILKYFKIKNFYILLILLGFFTHLFFEYLGLNKVYCKYGNACIKK